MKTASRTPTNRVKSVDELAQDAVDAQNLLAVAIPNEREVAQLMAELDRIQRLLTPERKRMQALERTAQRWIDQLARVRTRLTELQAVSQSSRLLLAERRLDLLENGARLVAAQAAQRQERLQDHLGEVSQHRRTAAALSNETTAVRNAAERAFDQVRQEHQERGVPLPEMRQDPQEGTWERV